VFVAVLMVASAVPLPAGGAPTPLVNQWGPVWLYLHSNDEMTPAPNNQETSIAPFTTRQWTMPEGLRKGLCIEGGEPGTGATAFDVVLNITLGPSSSAWSVSVRLKDEDSIIAQQTIDVDANPFPGLRTDWQLDYTSNRTSCQVLKGHRLQVEVVSSRTTNVPNIVGARLVIWAEDVLAPTISTANAAGPTDIFYPNDLDGSRSVTIKGVVNNAFPPSLVAVIRIGVAAPGGGAVANGTASLNDENFTFTWTYSRGITGGVYTVLSEVEDRQGTVFVATTTVTMASFGLKLTAPGQVNQSVTGYTVPGESAVYDLTVTNIGGQPTTVQMVTENPPVSGWSVSFSSSDFGLAAGASNVTVFRATPGASIAPGNSAQATVVAQARDDPAPVKARGTLLTTTIVIREAALSIQPPSTDATIRLGGSVEYDFTLTNNGGLTTDVSLEATAAPAGWTRGMEGADLVDGAGWKVIGLGPGASRTLTLNVTAPADSSSTDEFACTVTARAVGNASAVAAFVASTHLLLGIELSQASPTGVPAVAPGGTVEFQVDVVNTDPLEAHTITQAGTTAIPSAGNPTAVAGAGAPAIEVFAPADGSCCAPHSSATISVIVHMPAKALPGRYTIELATVVDGVTTQVAALNLTLEVTRDIKFSLRVDDTVGPLTVGTSSARFEMTVSNDGNALVLVDLLSTVGGARAGEEWDIVFLDQNGVEESRISIPPYESKIVTVEVTAAPNAFHGDTRQITLRGDQVGGDVEATLPAPIEATVELEPTVRFIRLLSAQWMVVFLLGFVVWGFITLSWGRAIRKRTRGGAESAAPEAPARTAREVK